MAILLTIIFDHVEVNSLIELNILVLVFTEKYSDDLYWFTFTTRNGSESFSDILLLIRPAVD